MLSELSAKWRPTSEVINSSSTKEEAVAPSFTAAPLVFRSRAMPSVLKLLQYLKGREFPSSKILLGLVFRPLDPNTLSHETREH